MRVVSTTGCGFFPWIPEAGATPDHNPTPLTLIEAMRWYWIVRTWTVDVALAYTDTSFGPPRTFEVIGSGVMTMSDGIGPVSREEELIIRGLQNALFALVVSEGGVDTGTPGNFLLQMFSAVDGESGVDTDDDETLWSPKIILTIDGILGADLLSLNTLSNPPQLSAMIDGQPIPLYSNPFYSWSGTVTITPLSFWPFGNRDNSEPIYDAVTGEEQRDPYAYEASA